jgi:ADP-ribose pyrophosphatase YjhB (NUDIX family)
MESPHWLSWARRLAALAQNGLAFAKDPFDRERYEAVRAIAAEMIAQGGRWNPEEVLAQLSGESGYATPKVDVRAVVFREDQILLVQERSDSKWSLPGGWADVGDAPSAAVVREVEEETGYQARATKLVAVYDKLRHGHPAHLFHAYKLFYRCEITGGSPRDSIETTGAAFFAEERIPPLSLGRVTEAQIRRMFQHQRGPDLPTDFD